MFMIYFTIKYSDLVRDFIRALHLKFEFECFKNNHLFFLINFIQNTKVVCTCTIEISNQKLH